MKADDYLNLPYHFRVVRDTWEDGTPGWFAEVEELPGCMTQAASLEELEPSLRDAIHAWIEVQLERGEPIPPPRSDDEPTHSGKFLVRLPKTLHSAVANEAESEGVSLNAFVVAALSGAVGWRSAQA